MKRRTYTVEMPVRCGMCVHFSFAFCMLEQNRWANGNCMVVEDLTDASHCPDFTTKSDPKSSLGSLGKTRLCRNCRNCSPGGYAGSGGNPPLGVAATACSPRSEQSWQTGGLEV